VLHTSALAFSALKWCGVVYLLYMAWQTLRERGALAVDGRMEDSRGRRVVVTGFLINILNPKLSIFFLAFLPQFIATGEPHPLARMLELSAVFMLMTYAVFVLCGRCPRPPRQPAQSDALAAPRLCRRLCPARRAPGAGGSLTAIKKRARPAALPSRPGARAELSTPPGQKNYFFFPFLAFFAFFAFFAFLAIVSSQGLMDGTRHERHARRRASLAISSIDNETDSRVAGIALSPRCRCVIHSCLRFNDLFAENARR
jgi:hypothetical protein